MKIKTNYSKMLKDVYKYIKNVIQYLHLKV